MMKKFVCFILLLCLHLSMVAQGTSNNTAATDESTNFYVDYMSNKITRDQLSEKLISFGIEEDVISAIIDQLDKIAKNRAEEDVWTDLPGHSTYEGSFEAFGLFERYGNAKYQYIQKSDGTRTFDGRFKYQAGDFTVTGQFKNDYQTGEWVFTDGEKTSKVNFNDSGCPDGAFEVYDYHIDDIKYEDGTRAGRVVMSQTKYQGVLDRGVITKIDFVTSNGYHPVILYNQGQATIVYMLGSNSVKYSRSRGWYAIDERTGNTQSMSDRQIGVKRGFSSFPVNTYDTTKRIFRHYLLRSTMRDYYSLF